ncbi:MAG: T9SS type A sorting domain-containing protein [Saprospiraceae bacterium]|nr:T9SS type A sorting domain-containing protein [Saprospiraceae bacterium]
MTIRKTLSISIFFLISFALVNTKISYSQTNYDIGFTRDFSVEVQDSLGLNYKNPWVGGMNATQFCEIDLNFDGIKDMFVFDKHGDKYMTYINNGTPNSIDYTYAPEYEREFPYMYGWVKMADYNCDGKNDIFTYYPGGISVYKNVSNAIDGLKFKLITPMLLSFQGLYYGNIQLSDEDYPGIVDIDNDGDLDIFVFYGLGTFLQYHKNLSMETYGTCDSLKFELAHNCWGYFAESEVSNTLFLNQTCWKGKSIVESDNKSSAPKHTGSTMLFLDLDNDLDKDLILGDVDYRNLIGLTNGGTLDTANIISQDTLFPSNTVPIDLVSFPCPSYIDINNDNLKDIIVSPFEGSYYAKATGFNSQLFYKNTGSSSLPIFTYQYPDIFQRDMIDVGIASMPVLYDYNNDSLLDLFVGNYGYIDTTYLYYGDRISEFRAKIAQFKNIGTQTQPKFKLITRDFANVSAQNLNDVRPTFGDIDGDGDIDMIIGEYNGILHFYENSAGVGNPWNLSLSQQNYMGIDVGKYSFPELVDIDNDSLLDLVIGEEYNEWIDSLFNLAAKKGNLNYYKNTGTATNPTFTLITDSLGRVDVTDNYQNYDKGYTIPCFFKDSLGGHKLLVGSGSGYIYYYKDIDSNLTGTFTVDSSLIYTTVKDDTLFYVHHGTIFETLDSSRLYIRVGHRAAPAIGDLNNDGYIDMIVGNLAGGLSFYRGNTPPPHDIGFTDIVIPDLKFNLYPNPATENITVQISEIPENTKVIIQIYNIVGKLIVSKTIINTNQTSIDVNDFSNGIYICRISSLSNKETSFSSTTKKFLVNH